MGHKGRLAQANKDQDSSVRHQIAPYAPPMRAKTPQHKEKQRRTKSTRITNKWFIILLPIILILLVIIVYNLFIAPLLSDSRENTLNNIENPYKYSNNDSNIDSPINSPPIITSNNLDNKLPETNGNEMNSSKLEFENKQLVAENDGLNYQNIHLKGRLNHMNNIINNNTISPEEEEEEKEEEISDNSTSLMILIMKNAVTDELIKTNTNFAPIIRVQNNINTMHSLPNGELITSDKRNKKLFHLSKDFTKPTMLRNSTYELNPVKLVASFGQDNQYLAVSSFGNISIYDLKSHIYLNQQAFYRPYIGPNSKKDKQKNSEIMALMGKENKLILGYNNEIKTSKTSYNNLIVYKVLVKNNTIEFKETDSKQDQIKGVIQILNISKGIFLTLTPAKYKQLVFYYLEEEGKVTEIKSQNGITESANYVIKLVDGRYIVGSKNGEIHGWNLDIERKIEDDKPVFNASLKEEDVIIYMAETEPGIILINTQRKDNIFAYSLDLNTQKNVYMEEDFSVFDTGKVKMKSMIYMG